ncbi:MAG: glycosyltransferase family 2 protein, partial [Caldilinea sp.]
MILLPLAVTAALAILLAIATTNYRRFPRLYAVETPGNAKTNAAPSLVSVLIPARNEAAIIGATLRDLLAQDVPNLEVLVLDDRSEDGTAEIVCETARRFPQVRLLCGKELPPGWTGKNWACAQLAEAAQGDILLFTDADVRWRPGALHSVLAAMDKLDADLLTVWPT